MVGQVGKGGTKPGKKSVGGRKAAAAGGGGASKKNAKAAAPKKGGGGKGKGKGSHLDVKTKKSKEATLKWGNTIGAHLIVKWTLTMLFLIPSASASSDLFEIFLWTKLPYSISLWFVLQ